MAIQDWYWNYLKSKFRDDRDAVPTGDGPAVPADLVPAADPIQSLVERLQKRKDFISMDATRWYMSSDTDSDCQEAANALEAQAKELKRCAEEYHEQITAQAREIERLTGEVALLKHEIERLRRWQAQEYEPHARPSDQCVYEARHVHPEHPGWSETRAWCQTHGWDLPKPDASSHN